MHEFLFSKSLNQITRAINKNNNIGVQDLLKLINKKECIHLNNHPTNIKVFSNNRLLVLNYLNDDKNDSTQCITINDKNYNFIQKVDKISGE